MVLNADIILCVCDELCICDDSRAHEKIFISPLCFPDLICFFYTVHIKPDGAYYNEPGKE